MASKKIKTRSGIDSLRKRYEEEEKASGRTPEQSRALRFMNFLLSSAARGQDFEIQPHSLAGVPENAEVGRKWLRQQIQECDNADHADILATMYFALGVLMENIALNEKAKRTPPRGKGPSADELCSSCRTRIEERYLPLMKSKLDSAIRLYFPVGQRRNFRANMIRAAWQTAREHTLFPSKGTFARYAKEWVNLTPRWIQKCIEDIPEDGRQA